jgi:hypothetical protein
MGSSDFEQRAIGQQHDQRHGRLHGEIRDGPASPDPGATMPKG